VDGQKILGFDFPNQDGSPGGFVSAGCHFHGTGEIKVDSGSMVLGSTEFVGGALIVEGSILAGHNRLEKSFVLASEINGSVLRCARMMRVICEDSWVDGGTAKTAIIKKSRASCTTMEKYTFQECRAINTTATCGKSALSSFEDCTLFKTKCSHTLLRNVNSKHATFKNSVALDCEIGPSVNVLGSKIKNRSVKSRLVKNESDWPGEPEPIPLSPQEDPLSLRARRSP
jgi:hypothetical protein